MIQIWELLNTILDFLSKFEWWGLPIIAIIIILLVVYRDGAEILDELNLWMTGSDVMIGRTFAHFMARRLKKHKGDVVFYNVPLATLEGEDARETLWENSIVRNHDLRLYLLLSPQQAIHLGELRSKHPQVKNVLSQMSSRLNVVIVEFPSQERVNYGCVLFPKKGRGPSLVTASFTLKGFWDWQDNSFACFLAFSPKRFSFYPSPVTHGMCETISKTAKDIIEAARQKHVEWEFRYGPTDADKIRSRIYPEIVPISELEKALSLVSKWG